MTDIAELQTLLDDAIVDRMRIVNQRNHKRRLMIEEMTATVDAAIAAEFDAPIAIVQDLEKARRTALEDARLIIGRKRLIDSNYRGLLVEWGRLNSNWYDTEKRHLLYPTGRRGMLQVCEHNSRFVGNNVPAIGDLFIRIIKNDGEPGLRHACLFNGEVGQHWLPVGEKPAQAG